MRIRAVQRQERIPVPPCGESLPPSSMRIPVPPAPFENSLLVIHLGLFLCLVVLEQLGLAALGVGFLPHHEANVPQPVRTRHVGASRHFRIVQSVSPTAGTWKQHTSWLSAASVLDERLRVKAGPRTVQQTAIATEMQELFKRAFACGRKSIITFLSLVAHVKAFLCRAGAACHRASLRTIILGPLQPLRQLLGTQTALLLRFRIRVEFGNVVIDEPKKLYLRSARC